MSQEPLFYESLYEALKEIVRMHGGNKPVGGLLWPQKTPEAARNLLSNCLDGSRPEKLDPEQVMLLLKMGREKNCHAAMNYIARETGYADPLPIEPDNERARLQREFIEAQKAMQALAGRMERAGLLGAA